MGFILISLPQHNVESPSDVVQGSVIDLAHLAMEQIALELEDYPRQEGEEFTFKSEFDSSDEQKNNPFQILAKLKKIRQTHIKIKFKNDEAVKTLRLLFLPLSHPELVSGFPFHVIPVRHSESVTPESTIKSLLLRKEKTGFLSRRIMRGAKKSKMSL